MKAKIIVLSLYKYFSYKFSMKFISILCLKILKSLNLLFFNEYLITKTFATSFLDAAKVANHYLIKLTININLYLFHLTMRTELKKLICK